jgi:hypothetical protein
VVEDFRGEFGKRFRAVVPVRLKPENSVGLERASRHDERRPHRAVPKVKGCNHLDEIECAGVIGTDHRCKTRFNGGSTFACEGFDSGSEVDCWSKRNDVGTVCGGPDGTLEIVKPEVEDSLPGCNCYMATEQGRVEQVGSWRWHQLFLPWVVMVA